MQYSVEQLLFPAPPAPYFLECGSTHYQPGDTHPNRRNLGKFDLIIMESGCLHIGEEEKNWSLTAGQSLLLNPDRYHYSVKPCTEATAFFWIHFHSVCDWRETDNENEMIDTEEHVNQFLTAPYSLTIPKVWTLPQPQLIGKLTEQLLKASTERRSSAFWTKQQTFEDILKLLDLRQFEQYESPAITVAETTEAFIKNNYRSAITSAMLTEELHFHYNYITRCMKQVYGLTPIAFLNHYRLEQAKLLLLKTDWPVAEIARYVGFENTPYFSSCFTNAIGLSPMKYRKQFMQGSGSTTS